MKIKLITTTVALLTLGAIGSALAGQGENNLNFTLNADVTQATPGNEVQFRLYDHIGTQLPLNSLNLTLQEVMDIDGNIVFGSTGNGGENNREIAPKDIYVMEVYSDNPATAYQTIKVVSSTVSLQHGSDTTNVISAHYAMLKDSAHQSYHSATQGKVPAVAIQQISTPQIFLLPEPYNGNFNTPTAGSAVYMPFSFLGWLPDGSGITDYTPGAYTGSGDIIVTATWA